MSVSIYYQPMQPTHLNVGGGKSSFLDMMSKVFSPGSLTQHWTLDSSNLGQLNTMLRTVSDTDHAGALFNIINVIESYGRVQVWAEY